MTDKIWIQTPQCLVCWKNGLIQVDDLEWARHQNGIEIHRSLSNSVAEREQIITGTHPGCWQEMFSEEE